jgi:Flp pilus assembly pilin Flp
MFPRRGQSLIEYATLLAIISMALIAMYPYMQRSINARLKQAQAELNELKR